MSTPESEVKSVFVSYTHTGKDKEFALQLSGDLKRLGVNVWLDEWELRVGDSLIGCIENGITGSSWMVVVLSSDALASEWFLRELKIGLSLEISNKSIFVLPVLYRPVELPSFLKDKIYADFTKSYEEGLSNLRDRLFGGYMSQSTKSWFLVKHPFSQALLEGLTTMKLAPLFTLPRKGDVLLSHLWELSNHDHRSLFRSMANMLTCQSPNSLPTSSTATQLWFGDSGRMLLRLSDASVYGDYDWYGRTLKGRIKGQADDKKILFDWSWSGSTEKGRGIFWRDIPNILYGGWWMDYDGIDENLVIAKAAEIPNRWEFIRLRALNLDLTT